MPNQFGLVSDIKKYGGGSLYVPFSNSGTDRFLITPVNANALDISAHEDFCISFWAQYNGDITQNGYYPIVKFGNGPGNGGFELGYYVTDTHASVYFSWIQNSVLELYTSGMTTANIYRIRPTSVATHGTYKQFDHWLVKRSGNTITLEFDNGFGPTGQQTGIYTNFGSPMSLSITATAYGNLSFSIPQVSLLATSRPTNVTGSNVWFDEFYFAKGISSPVNYHPTTGQILDGGLSTTQFLYNFDGDYYDNQGLLQTSEAALSSTATLEAQGLLTRTTSATLSSTAQISVQAKANRTTQASLTSTATLTMVTGRTVNASASLSAQATVSAQGGFNKPTSASLSADTTLTAQGILPYNRPRQFEVVNSTFSTTAKFGSYSLQTTAANGRNKLYGTPDWNIQSNQDFVVSFHIYPDKQNSSSTVTLMDCGAWTLQVLSTGAIKFNYGSNSMTGTTSQKLTANAWNWIQIRRISGQLSVDLRNGSNTYYTIGSTTYTGTFGDGSTAYPLYIGATPSVVNGINTVLYDEFYAAKGDGVLQNWYQDPFDNGAAASTIALFHFDNNLFDDMGPTLASAQLTAAATLTAQPNANIKQFAAIESSVAQLDAHVVKTANGIASLQTDGSIVTVNGRIRPEVAAMDSQFQLTASLSRTKPFSASLSNTATITATAIRIRPGAASLSALDTLVATIANNVKQGQVDLLATSTFYAKPDDLYLQLIYGATNTSGYITSSGTTIRTSYTIASYGGYPTYGWDPVQANFWVSLESNLTDGQQVIIYKSNTNEVVLQKGGTKPNGTSVTSGNYYIYTKNRAQISLTTNGTSWNRYNVTYFYGAELPGVDFTQSVNVHIPLSLGFYAQDFSTNGYTQPYGITKYGDVIKINGSTVSATTGASNSVASGSQGAYQAPTSTNEALGGQWGANTNPVTVYLDQIWIKADVRPNASDISYSGYPVTDFYDNGNPVYITTDGTTISSTQAQVWLPFGNLLDRSSLSPTWNYTSNNRVIPGWVKTTESYQTAIASLTASITKFVHASSDMSSTATVYANGGKIRYYSAALNATATVAATAVKIVQSTVPLNSAFTQTTNAIKATVGRSSASSVATMSTINSRTRATSSSMSSTATLSCSAIKTASAVDAMSSQATLTGTALRIRPGQAQFTAIATELTAAAKVGQALVHAQMTATVGATVKKIVNPSTTMSAVATVSANARKVVLARGEFTATATTTCDPTYLRRNEVFMTATATMITVGKLTRTTGSAMQTTATLIANNVRTRDVGAIFDAQATVIAQNQIVRLVSANLSSESSLFFSPYILVRVEANLQCEGFVMAVGRVIALDPALTLKVSSETRYLKVLPEVRDLIVESETRIYKIKDEL